MERGIIFDRTDDKNFCFIKSSRGEKIFVHANNVGEEIFRQLTAGISVHFISKKEEKGKSATTVIIDKSASINNNIDFSEVQIRDLFGDLAAEDETKERFSSYFMKTDLYEKIHNFLPIKILVAHKGIGKSAFFRMSYLENLKENVLCIWVRPDDIIEIANSKVETDPLLLIRQWKSGLEELIVKKVMSNFNMSSDKDTTNQLLQKGLNIADKIGLIINKVQDSVNLDTIKKAVALKYIKNNRIVIYIDDLDRAWNGTRQNIYRISALLNAIRDMTNSTEELCFRISLRSDVYYLVRTADESTDKIDGHVLWLKWTEHELLALLVKRVQSYFGNDISTDTLLSMKQQEMSEYLNDIMEDTFEGSGKWNNSPIRYILLSLIRRRPRDLINLCTLAARCANSKRHNIIKTEDWEDVFEQYSSSRLQDTINEHKYELPDIDRLLLGMRPSHEMKKKNRDEKPFVYNRERLCRKLTGLMQNGKFYFANQKECSAEELINFMYKINFLCARKNTADGYINRKYFEDNNYLMTKSNDFGYDWEVHPAFRWALYPESRDILYTTDIPSGL